MLRVSTFVGLTTLGTIGLVAVGYAFPAALVLSAFASLFVSNIDRMPASTFSGHYHRLFRRSDFSTTGYGYYQRPFISYSSPTPVGIVGHPPRPNQSLVSQQFVSATPAQRPTVLHQYPSPAQQKPGRTLVNQRFRPANNAAHASGHGQLPGSRLVGQRFVPR